MAQPAYQLTLYVGGLGRITLSRGTSLVALVRCCGRDCINGSVFLRRANSHCEYLSHTMIFKPTLLGLLVTSLAMPCVGQDDHDHHKDQMPLDYVRFPYQATYPGDNSGRCSAHDAHTRNISQCFSSQSPPMPSFLGSPHLPGCRGSSASRKRRMSRLISRSSALHL